MLRIFRYKLREGFTFKRLAGSNQRIMGKQKHWEILWFLDAIASPSTYPCQWVGQSVSQWVIVSDLEIQGDQKKLSIVISF